MEIWIQVQGPKINQISVPVKTDTSLFLDTCWQPVACQVQRPISNGGAGRASVLDKNEIQFPGMSFFRGREEKEEYS